MARGFARVLAVLAGLGLIVGVAACGPPPKAAPAKPAVKPIGYVFVMNTGSKTISVIDPMTNKVVKTIDAKGMVLAPYPSNQYATGTGYVLSGWKSELSILKVSGENVSLVKNLTLPASVTPNPKKPGTMMPQLGVWQDITSNGKLGVVAVREAEKILYIDMNPKSSKFGDVIYTLNTSNLGPNGVGVGP